MMNNTIKIWYTKRIYKEFWFISVIVGLGFVYGIPIGFYEFRLVDLIMILSFFYFIKLMISRKIEKKDRLIALLLITFIFFRTIFDYFSLNNESSIRTLFGMSITYLTPIVYFVVRESKINGKFAFRLLVIAWIIIFLSQMGLLVGKESEVAGAVDLSRFFNISSSSPISLSYQERTITVWRALSVGIVFAVLLTKTKMWIKFLGIIGLILQFGGDRSGGRGALVFLIVAPILLLYFQKNKFFSLKKIVLIIIVGGLLVFIYLWAPFGSGQPLMKTGFKETNFERATEIFTLFTSGWNSATDIGGFNGRTIGYLIYITNIFSNPNIFLWGVGFHSGAAFSYTANKQAHNMILDIWAISGIFGLALFLIIQYYIFVDLRNLLKIKIKSNYEKIIVISFATAILYFYQPLLFQAVSSDRSFMIVFYLTAGVLKPISDWIKIDQLNFNKISR